MTSLKYSGPDHELPNELFRSIFFPSLLQVEEDFLTSSRGQDSDPGSRAPKRVVILRAKIFTTGHDIRHKSLPFIFYRPYFLLFGGEGTKNFIKIQADIQADII